MGKEVQANSSPRRSIPSTSLSCPRKCPLLPAPGVLALTRSAPLAHHHDTISETDVILRKMGDNAR
ncbi:hypothetical protein KSD_00680 [Ktedonobacter sp. SOSP1-85]|nr:hypothetical protein KSD_00680 [Ktedonobacter sp. SOSP1-85]